MAYTEELTLYRQGGRKQEKPPGTIPKENDTATETDDMLHACACVWFPVTELIHKRKKKDTLRKFVKMNSCSAVT